MSSKRNIETSDLASIEQLSQNHRYEKRLYWRFYFVSTWLFLVTGLIPDYANEPLGVQTFIRWFFLFLLLGPTIWAIKGMAFTRAELGLTFNGSITALVECFYVFCILVPFLILAKIFSQNPIEPLFNWLTIRQYSSAEHWFYILSYLPHTAGQEFIARGVGILMVSRIMHDFTSLKPVLAISVLFAVCHLHLSVSIAVGVFVTSILFGTLYRRHKSLVGVVTLHFSLGITATALGLI
ncbi:CPBP family intramembrane metalloprotease [Paraglaciecola aquimarina]|uniref:CPBP family intramembrane metalloprotease n=1 Tax=Paraglaciecola algarum TaxID=3050085 RepID=A0ABS9DBP5_9ALTE|nr:CPBP family intramembrane glutamic endopeptidase [Paraglaciecola sp. G1-23]MCF2949447.1 CPBP family intramembrane metalloprotease [Paraglaciecola sp. G1-23]